MTDKELEETKNALFKSIQTYKKLKLPKDDKQLKFQCTLYNCISAVQILRAHNLTLSQEQNPNNDYNVHVDSDIDETEYKTLKITFE